MTRKSSAPDATSSAGTSRRARARFAHRARAPLEELLEPAQAHPAYDGLDQDYALSERAQMANVTVTPDGWRASKTIGW